jgi:bifunctional DNA-binding transcriptional regulator/antitoxin component of YhaV-PrlF toxin-antitoxin module
MTVTVKNKTPLVVPSSVRRQASLKSGRKIEFEVSGGVISIYPKLPSPGDAYTPEQRRIVDAQLAEGLADVEAGRVNGPFDTHKVHRFAPRGSSERNYAKASQEVQRAFDKQSLLLIQNLHHTSLRAKKYDESRGAVAGARQRGLARLFPHPEDPSGKGDSGEILSGSRHSSSRL